MKKNLTHVMIALVGLMIAFTGCTKKSDSPSYSMKATVGGSAYSAGNCIASVQSSILIIEGLGGSSTAPTFPYVAIWVSNWNGSTGTFNFDSSGTTNWAEYLTSATAVSESASGSVVITAATTTTVSGTFSFTGTDGKVVSGGSFTAKRS